MTVCGGAGRRLQGGREGGGQVTTAGGAPLKIPIDWPISLEKNKQNREMLKLQKLKRAERNGLENRS